jgi:hypothetical protein
VIATTMSRLTMVGPMSNAAERWPRRRVAVAARKVSTGDGIAERPADRPGYRLGRRRGRLPHHGRANPQFGAGRQHGTAAHPPVVDPGSVGRAEVLDLQGAGLQRPQDRVVARDLDVGKLEVRPRAPDGQLRHNRDALARPWAGDDLEIRHARTLTRRGADPRSSAPAAVRR